MAVSPFQSFRLHCLFIPSSSPSHSPHPSRPFYDLTSHELVRPPNFGIPTVLALHLRTQQNDEE